MGRGRGYPMCYLSLRVAWLKVTALRRQKGLGWGSSQAVLLPVWGTVFQPLPHR